MLGSFKGRGDGEMMGNHRNDLEFRFMISPDVFGSYINLAVAPATELFNNLPSHRVRAGR